MDRRSTIRRPQRWLATAMLIAFTTVLAGCSSDFGTNWDPTDLLDFLDTKKKLAGERKPVFPEGVPGLDQGVPRELYKGNAEREQQIEQQNAAAAAAPPQQPLEPPPGSKASLKKLKGKPQQTAAAPAAAAPAAEPDGEATAAGDPAAAAAPPAPKPKKIVRRRTTAPPPDQPAQAGAPQSSQPAQQSQSAFPAPLPGGNFSR